MVQLTADWAMKETDQYLETFERFEAQAKQPPWVFPLRKAGMARFAELGFPTVQQEDWRFTNVAPIAKLPFRPVLQGSRDGLTAEAVAAFTFGKLAASRLVFVNGHYAAELSSPGPQSQGVIVSSLAAALAGRFGVGQGASGALCPGRRQPVYGTEHGFLPGRRLCLCARRQAPGGAGPLAVHLDRE